MAAQEEIERLQARVAAAQAELDEAERALREEQRHAARKAAQARSRRQVAKRAGGTNPYRTRRTS